MTSLETSMQRAAPSPLWRLIGSPPFRVTMRRGSPVQEVSQVLSQNGRVRDRLRPHDIRPRPKQSLAMTRHIARAADDDAVLQVGHPSQVTDDLNEEEGWIRGKSEGTLTSWPFKMPPVPSRFSSTMKMS
jgi:hypothetical protein